MRLNPATKMCPGKEIEKKVVREAFADMLPESVAWRQKEQFSDGVGYSWIDTLKAVTAAAVSDEQMRKASERFPTDEQRGILLPHYFRGALPQRECRPQCTQRTECSLFHRRSIDMGRLIPREKRP